MPRIVVALCVLLAALLAVEAAVNVLVPEGDGILSIIDAVLVVCVITSMKPTAKDRNTLRLISAILAVSLPVITAWHWPPPVETSFEVADLVVNGAITIACVALFVVLQLPHVVTSYDTRTPR